MYTMLKLLVNIYVKKGKSKVLKFNLNVLSFNLGLKLQRCNGMLMGAFLIYNVCEE